MKFQPVVLLAVWVALSGFTWGSSDSQKTTSAKKTVTAKKVSSNVKPASAPVRKTTQTAMTYSNSAYVPAPTTDNRAAAVRVLTAGDEATRKARLESLSRIAKSLAAAKQAQQQ